MEMRKCSKCEKELSVDNFSINPKSDELYKSCNVCIEYIKSYNETNKEKKTRQIISTEFLSAHKL